MSTRGSRVNQGGIQIQVEHETDTYVTVRFGGSRHVQCGHERSLQGYEEEAKRGDTYQDIEEGQVKHDVPYANDVSTTALTHPEQTLH